MNKSQKILSKVKDINEDNKEYFPNEETIRAIEEAEKGDYELYTWEEFVKLLDEIFSEKDLPDE